MEANLFLVRYKISFGSDFSVHFKEGPGTGVNLTIDTRRGEILLGFYLRAGAWIDGLEILTSLGRRSGVYGNPKGGSG